MKLLMNFIDQSARSDRHQLYLIYNKAHSPQINPNVLLQQPQLVLICDICQRKLNQCSSVLVTYGQQTRDCCITCFLGMDMKGKDYYYQIRHTLNMSITKQGWSILDQLLLLNAMQRFGFGNWGQVANYLDYHNANFTQKQIEQHYIECYIQNQGKQMSWNTFIQITEPRPYFRDVSGLKIMELAKDEQQNQIQIVQAYNSKREEHLFDYDPLAQKGICDLQFNDLDSPQEIELKFIKLEEYHRRINERRKREEFVIEHQLLNDQNMKNMLKAGIAKRDTRNQMKCFLKYQNKQEAEILISYLTLQSTLKATISQLAKQRKRQQEPSFQEVYSNLEQKRIKRSFEVNASIASLKVHYDDRRQPSKKRMLTPSGQAGLENCFMDQLRKKVKSTQLDLQNCRIVSFSLQKQ